MGKLLLCEVCAKETQSKQTPVKEGGVYVLQGKDVHKQVKCEHCVCPGKETSEKHPHACGEKHEPFKCPGERGKKGDKPLSKCQACTLSIRRVKEKATGANKRRRSKKTPKAAAAAPSQK
jgi:hypothetical protein